MEPVKTALEDRGSALDDPRSKVGHALSPSGSGLPALDARIEALSGRDPAGRTYFLDDSGFLERSRNRRQQGSLDNQPFRPRPVPLSALVLNEYYDFRR